MTKKQGSEVVCQAPFAAQKHSASMYMVTAILLFMMALLLSPAVAYADDEYEILPNTEYDTISGYYELDQTHDSGRAYTVVGDTVIRLNGYGFAYLGEAGYDTALFNVSPGVELTIIGNGMNKNLGISGYDKFFKLGANSTLNLQDLNMCETHIEDSLIIAEGDNITVNMSNSRMYANQISGNNGFFYVKGNNFKLYTDEKSKFQKNQGSDYVSVLHLEGDNALISGASFIDNSSEKSAGAIRITGNDCTIKNCKFKSNTSVDENGGAVCANGNNCTLVNCEFADNNGGAVWVKGANCIIDQCSFDASYVDTVLKGGFEFLAIEPTKVKNVDHSEDIYIKGDSAKITGTTLDSSKEEYHCGSVRIEGNNCCVEHSTIKKCYSSKNGGGLSIIGDNAVVNDIDTNSCYTADGGGTVYIEGSRAAVSDVRISSCDAASSGGAIYVNGHQNTFTDIVVKKCFASSAGGGFYIVGEKNTLERCDIDCCSSRSNGGAISVDGSGDTIKDTEVRCCLSHYKCGGAIYLEGKGHRISGSRFYKNQTGENYGGAIYTDAENVQIENCDFRGNEAGQVFYTYVYEYNEGFYPLSKRIEQASGDWCTLYHGGAIYINDDNTNISQCTFSENFGKDGGAVYYNGDHVSIKECSFNDNYCKQDGGAVYFDEDHTILESSTFKRNTAKRYGGAVYYNGADNTLSGLSEQGTVIEGNSADSSLNYGHGVFVDDEDITLEGRLFIENNSNIDINEIENVTKDKIPTWSNLCLYDDTELAIGANGLKDDSLIWVDSDWGHYKKPAGGYIYKKEKWNGSLKAAPFRSDRSGFHFIEKNNTLYYEEGAEENPTMELPVPTVSIAPTPGEIWTKSPGRVYIDCEKPHGVENFEKHYTVTKKVNSGAWTTVPIENENGRDYVDVTGEKGETVNYKFDLSCSGTIALTTGGRKKLTSEQIIVGYGVETQDVMSRVRIQSAYESIGELVEEDLGKGIEGAVFKYSGMRYPVVKEGQEIEGWKLRVAGEEEDRDIDVDWDENMNSISFTLPEGLDGKDVLLIPQRKLKTYKVTYNTVPEVPDGIELPENTTLSHGSSLTVEPLGKDTGMRSIGSMVNDKATWGRKAYTVDVTSDIVVFYIMDDRDSVTVRFDDDMVKATVGEEKSFTPGQSFVGAGFKPADSAYKMNEIDHFQVLHAEEVRDDNGNVVLDDNDKPVTEEVYNESLTLGVNDPILDDYTLKPIWTQTVKISVNCRSTDGILAKEMSLEGGNKNGETITADIKTGEKVSLSYAAPEGKRLAGWTVTYYSWHSASSPGWTDSVASDSVKADGQKIASKVNSDGGALYSLDDRTFGFTITDDMKAIKTNTPLRIAITPIFKDVVTEINGVPDEMNMGDVFDLSSVKIQPAGAASASDIQWTRRDVNGEKELSGTFSPDSTGATMLEARIKDGLGIGTDYVQSFKVEAGTVRLVFYKDMAGKTIGKELSVEAGTPLAEYADTVPEEIPEDYSFAGWTFEPREDGVYSYKETIGNESILFDLEDNMPAQTLRLYPVFIKDRLKVELDLGDGGSESAPASFGPRPDGEEQSGEFYAEINEKLQMDALNTATRPGYELVGWFTSGGVRCTDDWAITPKYCDVDEKGEPVIGRKDNFDYYTLRLTAKWVPQSLTVKYIVSGEETVLEGGAAAGTKLILPDAPEAAEDMMFDYWADKNDGRHAPGEEILLDDDKIKTLMNDDGIITFSAMFVGKADPEGPTLNYITFDTAGGSYIPAISADPGTPIEAPEAPVREGFQFDGWITNGTDGFPEVMPETDIIVTAKWTAMESRITFETNGGSKVEDITGQTGTDIRNKKPEDPTREHYTFTGWMPAYPDVMPEKELILYALWTPAEYTLTYDANGGTFTDGSATIVQKGIYDSLVFVAGDPVRKGYTFSGWDSSTYSHMPGENKTIKAVWTKGEEPAGGNDKPSGGNDKPSGGNNKPAATTEKTDNTVKAGSKFKIAGNTYKVISAKKKTVSLAKAVKSKKTFVLPASVKIKGKKYKVTGIEKMAFKGTKTKTITIKTKKLKKKSVKGSLKGSKVKTIKVKVGKKSLNKKYVKKYKKIFTKKNAGKKVTVK